MATNRSDMPWKKFGSSEEADRANRAEMRSRSPQARLDLGSELRNLYWELYFGREPEFRRVC